MMSSHTSTPSHSGEEANYTKVVGGLPSLHNASPDVLDTNPILGEQGRCLRSKRLSLIKEYPNEQKPLVYEWLSLRSVDLGKWKGEAMPKRYAHTGPQLNQLFGSAIAV
jgi:hypothetical protein